METQREGSVFASVFAAKGSGNTQGSDKRLTEQQWNTQGKGGVLAQGKGSDKCLTEEQPREVFELGPRIEHPGGGEVSGGSRRGSGKGKAVEKARQWQGSGGSGRAVEKAALIPTPDPMGSSEIPRPQKAPPPRGVPGDGLQVQP